MKTTADKPMEGLTRLAVAFATGSAGGLATMVTIWLCSLPGMTTTLGGQPGAGLAVRCRG